MIFLPLALNFSKADLISVKFAYPLFKTPFLPSKKRATILGSLAAFSIALIISLTVKF